MQEAISTLLWMAVPLGSKERAREVDNGMESHLHRTVSSWQHVCIMVTYTRHLTRGPVGRAVPLQDLDIGKRFLAPVTVPN